MYRGFFLDLVDVTSDAQRYYKIGLDLYNQRSDYTTRQLNKYISPSGTLSGAQMQDDWFPSIEADLFISHSHQDLNNVITLSGWLLDVFDLRCFIDSCIWGYANDLLKLIDDKYCKMKSGDYQYEARNRSTSHVHMMLASALSKMIDKTECLFFYSTPNSVAVSDINNQTPSPWIYHEISISQYIRKKGTREHRKPASHIAKLAEDREIAKLEILHDINTTHLTKLTANDLNKWKRGCRSGVHVLDTLYQLNPEVPNEQN